MARLSLLIPVLAQLGCNAYTGGTDGENGLFSFYEPNEYPDDEALSSQGFELPIALGARVDVWFTSAGVSSFESAAIDDPAILSIESQIYPIVLRARSEGTTRLHATQSDGATDAIPLTVVAADGARVWILEQVLGNFGNSQGLALRPGASLRIAGQPKSGSTPLLGFDVLDWSIDENLFDQQAAATVNTRRIEATGASGVATITTQFGGSLEVATLSAQDPVDLTLNSIATGATVETTSIQSEDLPLFSIVATDAVGREVKPSPQDERDFTATIVSGTVTILEAQLGNRLASIRACAGTGMVEFSYLGTQLTVPIEVSADAADAECP
jgi:hypothetical protein